jgi:hypothetical protein
MVIQWEEQLMMMLKKFLPGGPWTCYHTGKNFTKSYLPITRQRDGYSCGILAWNAIAAYLLPDFHTLIDAADVADKRLRMFL